MSRSKEDALSMREYMAEKSRRSQEIREIGGPIFEHVAEHIGDFDAEYPGIALSHKVDVVMYGATVRKDPASYVYVTLGLFRSAREHMNQAVEDGIEQGAVVPPDLLASISGWCSPEDVAYCLDTLGLDVNFMDHVGYTALDRATAFHNEATCRALAERGGVLHDRA